MTRAFQASMLLYNPEIVFVLGEFPYLLCFIPLFHTGPESHELTRIDKYLDSWLNRTQFVKVLTDSHSP